MTRAAAEDRPLAKPLWRRILLLRIPFPFSLRGRFPRVEDLMAQSSLPEDLRALVTLVVRRTRLWERERSDVARELIAHFGDGLELGRPADELVRHFGDPRTAAELIRRAKRRNRHWLWHLKRRIGQAIGVLVLVLLVLYARFFVGSPSIKRNYIAEFNVELEKIPEAERAWPVYRRGLMALPVWPESLRGGVADQKTLTEVRPGDGEWSIAAEYLESAGPAMELFRQAAALPSIGQRAEPYDGVGDHELGLHMAVIYGKKTFDAGEPRPQDSNPPLVDLSLPNLGNLRQIAKLLASDALLRAQLRQPDRCESDLRSILGVARHANDRGFLICQLVGCAISGYFDKTVAELLEHSPEAFDRVRLASLAHRATTPDSVAADFERALLAERMFFEDYLQRTLTDDGRGDGRMTPAGVRYLYGIPSQLSADPIDELPHVAEYVTSPLLIASRRTQLETYDTVLRQVSRVMSTSPWSAESVETDAECARLLHSSVLSATRLAPVALYAPAFDKAARSFQRAKYSRDALLTVLAAHACKADSGSWPETLEALVPRHIPALPIDMFDGKPLKYRLIDGTPVIYSIGANRIDDGGSPSWKGGAAGEWISPAVVERARRERNRNDVPPGDWIFFPPSRAHADLRPTPAPN